MVDLEGAEEDFLLLRLLLLLILHLLWVIPLLFLLVPVYLVLALGGAFPAGCTLLVFS